MNLEYFHPDEFQGWYDKLSPKLLVLLDLFRYRLGVPVNVSRHPSSIGRDGGCSSQHCWEQFGEVRAIDLLPTGLVTQPDAIRMRRVAIDCGFTGIGIYPHWMPSAGFHVDVRDAVKMGQPATWGAIRPDHRYPQKYVSFDHAVSWLPEGPV